jgi:hypothetical protein
LPDQLLAVLAKVMRAEEQIDQVVGVVGRRHQDPHPRGCRAAAGRAEVQRLQERIIGDPVRHPIGKRGLIRRRKRLAGVTMSTECHNTMIRRETPGLGRPKVLGFKAF